MHREFRGLRICTFLFHFDLIYNYESTSLRKNSEIFPNSISVAS